MKRLTSVAGAVALASAFAAGSVNAGPLFWAINQFTNIQELDGDTGNVVVDFAVPFLPGRAASIAVIGNIGYYTILDDLKVYKVNMTSHLALGTAFAVSGLNYSGQNGITPDSAGHLWFAGSGSSPLLEYDTAGTQLSSHTFPSAANSYRDGSVVFNGFAVTNRGDQQGPYDKYSIPGGNGPLSLVASSFITKGSGSNGIAFNGVNFYTSDETAHVVSKWDINGVFVSSANLLATSRYENWTFASQDIIVGKVPEPGSLALVGLAVAGLALVRRRRTAAECGPGSLLG